MEQIVDWSLKKRNENAEKKAVNVWSSHILLLSYSIASKGKIAKQSNFECK